MATTLLSVGASFDKGSNLVLPPGEKAVELMVELPGACSERMSEPSTTVVGVFFHMHKHGKFQYIEHWRNGTRLPDLAKQHWDFNFQTGQSFAPERFVEVRRGDSLVSHCIYDTSDATEVIRGGDGSDDEMCVAFLRTYPPPDLQWALAMDVTLAKMAPMGVPANSVVCLAGHGELNGMSVGLENDGREAALALLKASVVDKTEDFSDAPYRETRSRKAEADAMGYAKNAEASKLEIDFAKVEAMIESMAHSLTLSVGPLALAYLVAALLV